MKANWRKISFRVFVVLAVVLVAVLTARAILNYTTGRRLEAFLQKARAEGAALRIRDLVRDCPDADNAAKLWKAAEVLVGLDDKDKAILGKPLEDSFYRRPLEDGLRSRLASLIEKNRRALDLAAEASSRHCLRLGLWEAWAGGAGEGPVTDMVKMIQVTKLLAIDALLRADRGEIVPALEECRAGLRLARLLADEPSLLSALVGVADFRQMVVTLGRIAEEREIGREALASWIGDLDPQPWHSLWARVIPAERANSLEVGLKIIGGDAAAIVASSGPDASTSRFWSWVLRPVIKSEILWRQEALEQVGKIIMLPYFEQRQPLMKLSQRMAAPPWYFRMTGALMPDFHAPALKEAMLEATMLATRTGLAARLYKLKAGQFPASLEALVPDILSAVPIDPFTGKPLVYKVANGELLIYSVGSNQKDDGGRGTMQITQMVMDKDDDWTWRDRVR